MSMFQAIGLGREGFTRKRPVKHFALQMFYRNNADPLKAYCIPRMYHSDTGLDFTRVKTRGDLDTLCSQGLLFIPSEGKAMCQVRNGRMMIYGQYFEATDNMNSFPVAFYTDDGYEFKRSILPYGKASGRKITCSVMIGTRLVAFLNTGESMYSDDNGETYSAGVSTGLIAVNDAASNGTTIAVVGRSASISCAVAYSTNIATTAFTVINGQMPYTPYCMGWGNNLWIIGAALGNIATAPNALGTFTLRTAISANNVSRLFYNGGRWFADCFGDDWMTSTAGTSGWSDASVTYPYWAPGDSPALNLRIASQYIGLDGNAVVHWNGAYSSKFNGTVWTKGLALPDYGTSSYISGQMNA